MSNRKRLKNTPVLQISVKSPYISHPIFHPLSSLSVLLLKNTRSIRKMYRGVKLRGSSQHTLTLKGGKSPDLRLSKL
ncbi:unnamed protein product, partial [Sphagnum jensenii]